MVEKREKYRFPFQRNDWKEAEYISAMGVGLGCLDPSSGKFQWLDFGACLLSHLDRRSSEQFLGTHTASRRKDFWDNLKGWLNGIHIVFTLNKLCYVWQGNVQAP